MPVNIYFYLRILKSNFSEETFYVYKSTQAFYYLTKDLMNKFELKSYNIHEVVYNMLNVNTPISINKFKELMRIKEEY